jgi:hypothetical protein
MENTTRIKQTTRTKVTSYGGTPAEVWEYLTAGRMGERVTVGRWLADNDTQAYLKGDKIDHRPVRTGQIDLTHCKGDGRKPSFQVSAKHTVSTRVQADAWAAERLS